MIMRTHSLLAQIVHVLVVAAIFYGYDIYALDFKNFYLRGVLEGPPVYAEQPPLFKAKGKENWACQLNLALYGLPQSGRVAQKNSWRL